MHTQTTFDYLDTEEGLDLDFELARILEIIYEDGLYHPRDMDTAKEAIWGAFEIFLDKYVAKRYNGTQKTEKP